MESAPSQSKRVEALTGTRALAAIYVLLLHWGGPLFAHAPAWAQRLRESAYTATAFFITLSGFILVSAYGRKLAEKRMSGLHFVLLRVARLYPLYLIALLMLVPLALVPRWAAQVGLWSLDTPAKFKLMTGVAQAAMAHVLSPKLTLWWNVPGWCVSVELWLCLVFPFVATRMLALSKKQLTLMLLAIYAFAVGLSIRFALRHADASFETRDYWVTMYKFAPFARWPEFFFGAALGAFWVRVPREERTGGAPWMIGSAALILLVLLFSDRVPYVLLHNGLLLPLYGAFIWGVVKQGSILHRALAWRPVTALGESSYSLYLLQFPAMYWLMLLTGHGENDLPPLFSGLAMIAIVAFSVAMHFWLELRLQKKTRELVDSLPHLAEPKHVALPAQL